jgi:hypothetical protein
MSIKWNVADKEEMPEIGQKIWLLEPFFEDYGVAYKNPAIYLGDDKYNTQLYKETTDPGSPRAIRTIFYALWIPYE